MKILAGLTLPLLCLAAANTPAIQSAIDMARGAPGEFAADALIRIAALEQVEKPRKLELLEQAFHRAAEAQEPYKRRAAITNVTGSAGFYNRAYDQDLDGLTLRLRAVQAMLPLDPRKARELFLDIPRINLPKLKCEEFLVYDVSRYYEVLGAVAKQGFSAKEIEKGEPFRLVLLTAGAITSPVQVTPAARMIMAATLKDGDFQAVVSAFTSALGQIRGDDRSFTFAHSTAPEIYAITEELKKRKMSPLPLLESYRLYLVSNLAADRCADDNLMQSNAQAFGLADTKTAAQTDDVEYFNLSLRMPPLHIIEAAEITPSKAEGIATGLRTCDDSECKAIAEQFRALMFQSNGMGYSTADRKSSEWQQKLQDFLNAVASWKESSDSTAAQFYRSKSGVYADLLNLVATPENQETVLRALLAFAQQNKFQVESRLQWFLPVNALLGRAVLDPRGTGKLMEDFRNAADPVIAMYAQLETVAPRGPERIMPLL